MARKQLGTAASTGAHLLTRDDADARYIGLGTDVPITDGGTGASTAADARTNLGVGTGDSPQFAAVNVGHATDTTVSRHAAGDIAVEGNLVYRAGGTDVPVADGGTGASTAAAAATNLGLGTGNSPQFTAINLGHASDTTIARVSAGDISIEGNTVYRAGGTDVAVADGGTGASTATQALVNLGGPIGYVYQTANWDSPTSGTTKLYVGTTSVTCLASRRYKVTLLLDRGWYGTVVGDVYTVGLEVDTVDKGNVPVYIDVANQYIPPGSLTLLVTGLSAGSRSFRAYSVRNSGTGSMRFRGAILIEDIGPG